jgi:ribokinase
MVVVFGSLNVDLVARVARFPQPGETVAATSFATYPGGKGANQALAAARAGAAVQLYGAVGRDAFADDALKALGVAGVGLEGVTRVGEPTGCATILVDDRAENCIVVAAGANDRADPDAVPDTALGPDTTLVLQHEVPEAANAVLVARARRRSSRIVLNAAPARRADIDRLCAIDVLVVNESEAATLATPLRWPVDAEGFARAATAACPQLAIVVTLGARGAFAFQDGARTSATPPAASIVDTTGAGDAFVGALAAALDRGAPLRDAIARAVAAGTLACTIRGAQPSMPGRDAIEALLPLVTVTTQ